MAGRVDMLLVHADIWDRHVAVAGRRLRVARVLARTGLLLAASAHRSFTRVRRETQIADAVRSSVGVRPVVLGAPWISSVLCVTSCLLAAARRTPCEIFVLVA
jgi:hypothetical protein